MIATRILSACQYRMSVLYSRAYHGIRERCRHRNYHPPHQPFGKLLAFALYKAADQPPIKFSDVKTNQRPQHKEYRIAPQKPDLGALPSRHTYPEQLPQTAEELPVQLDLLLPSGIAFPFCRPSAGSSTPSFRNSCSRGFLFFDSVPDPVCDDQEECEVHTARDARAVRDVESREVLEEAFQRACRVHLGESGRLTGHCGRPAAVENGDMECKATWMGARDGVGGGQDEVVGMCLLVARQACDRRHVSRPRHFTSDGPFPRKCPIVPPRLPTVFSCLLFTARHDRSSRLTRSNN